MLKKPVSFVLVSLKVSTYQPGTTPVPTDVGWQGENPYASSGRLWALTGHGPLTDSPARTNVALFIHRAVLVERPFEHPGDYNRKELDYPEFSSLASSKRRSNCSLCDRTSPIEPWPSSQE